jgi:hypothetical protein
VSTPSDEIPRLTAEIARLEAEIAPVRKLTRWEWFALKQFEKRLEHVRILKSMGLVTQSNTMVSIV